MKFSRVSIDANQMGGVPCIRGLRIPVSIVVGMLSEGMTEKEILDAYPDLDSADLKEALAFAAEALRERQVPLLPAV